MRHFPVSRRSTSPMAIGRTPPCGLGMATKLAPATRGAAALWALPEANKVTTPASCSRRLSRPPGQHASRRCWTRSPEGPGAVAAGKLRNALATASGTSSGLGGSSCTGGATGSGWTGCKAWRAATVPEFSGARPSASKAPQALPSNPSRARLVARSRRSAAVRVRWRVEGRPRLSHNRSRSPSSHRRRRSKV